MWSAAALCRFRTLVMHYFTVDTTGGLWWIDDRAKGIRHLAPERQLDAHSAPVYRISNARLLPVPAAFAAEGGVMRGLEVDPNGSSLFVFGFTKELPSTLGRNHPGGRLVVRLDLAGAEPKETPPAVGFDAGLRVGQPDEPPGSLHGGGFQGGGGTTPGDLSGGQTQRPMQSVGWRKERPSGAGRHGRSGDGVEN
jgi:hypothetical protein